MMMEGAGKILLWVLGAPCFIYLALVLMTYFFQRNMMYFPSGAMPVSTSAIAGISEIAVTTKDNLLLKAWYLPATGSRPTILSFHGNASTMEWQSKRLAPFAEKGFGVLIASYRGYNGNAEKPTEGGLYLDGHAYLDWLNKNGVPDSQIILYGESLGTGVAVELAVQKNRRFHALMLESPYTSTVDVAKQVYPFLPIRLLMKDRYNSLSKISSVQTPVIIAHGTNDTIVPFAQGKALFEVAPEPKTFIEIEGGAHANLAEFGVTEKYFSVLSE